VSALLFRWPVPLQAGKLVRRYERFIAEVQLGERLVRAHCVNPGRMEGLIVPGAPVWLSPAPGRKLEWTWEMMELEGRLVGVNTTLPNRLVGEVLKQGLLPELLGQGAIVAEQAYGRGHRVDFMMGEDHYVEVKNCHLVYPDGYGYFPDSKSERATAHVEALTRLVKQGKKATVIFTVQRDDGHAVRPSALHDPAFAVAMRAAVRAGLVARAIRLTPTLEGVVFGGELKVDVEKYELNACRRWSAQLNETSGWERKDGRFAGRSLPVK
jgi:sugar fermentation stimulation protein A